MHSRGGLSREGPRAAGGNGRIKGGVGTRESDLSLSHTHLCRLRALSWKPPDPPRWREALAGETGLPWVPALQSPAPQKPGGCTALSPHPAHGPSQHTGLHVASTCDPDSRRPEVTWMELTQQQGRPNPQAPPAPSSCGRQSWAALVRPDPDPVEQGG